MTNTRLVLFALAAMFLTSCAGMGAAETAGVAVAGIGAFAGFLEALAPMLAPEELAKLQAGAAHVDNVVTAAQTAVGTIAQAMADLKAQQASEAAGAFTDGEQTALLGGVTAGGVALSRYLSHRRRQKSPIAID